MMTLHSNSLVFIIICLLVNFQHGTIDAKEISQVRRHQSNAAEIYKHQLEHPERGYNLRSRSNSRKAMENIVESDLAFNFKDCDSYDNKWLFDVTFSCARGECRCDDAKERIEKNEIPCDKAITQCPEDCTICDFCMEQLGCL